MCLKILPFCNFEHHFYSCTEIGSLVLDFNRILRLADRATSSRNVKRLVFVRNMLAKVLGKWGLLIILGSANIVQALTVMNSKPDNIGFRGLSVTGGFLLHWLKVFQPFQDSMD